MLKPAVFLDRDGVLNHRPPEHYYVTSPQELRLLPRAIDALRLIKGLGFVLVVVTNQQGIERGLFQGAELEGVHDALKRRLRARGATLDGIYVCPHLATAGCLCRKPAPGLLLQAARELGISLGDSVMIGDSSEDIEAGRSAGCKTLIKVCKRQQPADPFAHHVCSSLWQAARLISQRRPS